MLLEIKVKGRTSCEVLDVLSAVESHLVDDVQRLVLHDVEIAVVAVTWHYISVFPIPFCMLHADVLSWDHLAVEQSRLGAVLLLRSTSSSTRVNSLTGCILAISLMIM